MRSIPFYGSTFTNLKNSSDEVAAKPERAFWWHNRATWKVETKLLPKQIWYCWNKEHELAKIGFTAPHIAHAPKSFDVIGLSHDKKHTVLLHVHNSKWSKPKEFKSWVVPDMKRAKFPCFGLKLQEPVGEFSGWF